MFRCASILALLLAAGAAAEADPVREAIDAGNYFVMKSFETRDAATLADHYTEDARLIPPGAEPVAGRAAIAAFWAEVMKTTASVKLETLSVEAFGDHAIEEGVGRLRADDGTESTVRYVVVWKRVGRRWHLHRDIWNSAAAPAAPPAEPPPAPAAEPGPEATPSEPPSEPSAPSEEPVVLEGAP